MHSKVKNVIIETCFAPDGKDTLMTALQDKRWQGLHIIDAWVSLSARPFRNDMLYIVSVGRENNSVMVDC